MTALDLTKVAPYSEDTPDLLTRSMSHIARAKLVLSDDEVIDLDLEDGTVSFDETRAPRVEARLTCRLFTDQALLDRIDPRTGARLAIDVGYLRPDQNEDVQPFVDLGLRSRRVSRPEDTLALTALSDEALMIDNGYAPGSLGTVTTTASIEVVIDAVFDPDPSITVTTGTTPGVTGVVFEDRWDVAQDLADRIDAQVYDNGLRAWFIAPAPVLAANPALALAVGSNGTIIATDTGLDRDDGFANQVALRYEWTDSGGTDHVVKATRRITTGPYAAVTGNVRTLKFDREVAATQTEANAAAAALVKRTVTRGRSFTVRAISAYWLRPGHTVEMTLPIGDPEMHLVSAVEFDLRAGTMRVTTRLPDGTYTIGA